MLRIDCRLAKAERPTGFRDYKIPGKKWWLLDQGTKVLSTSYTLYIVQLMRGGWILDILGFQLSKKSFWRIATRSASVGFGQPTDQISGSWGCWGVVEEGEKEQLGMSLRFWSERLEEESPFTEIGRIAEVRRFVREDSSFLDVFSLGYWIDI